MKKRLNLLCMFAHQSYQWLPHITFLYYCGECQVHLGILTKSPWHPSAQEDLLFDVELDLQNQLFILLSYQIETKIQIWNNSRFSLQILLQLRTYCRYRTIGEMRITNGGASIRTSIHPVEVPLSCCQNTSVEIQEKEVQQVLCQFTQICTANRYSHLNLTSVVHYRS